MFSGSAFSGLGAQGLELRVVWSVWGVWGV